MTDTYARHAVTRLRGLAADVSPRWGTMSAAQMIGHLRDTVRYTMGEGVEMPYRGTWKSRYVFRPLIIGQVVKIPRNVRIPNPSGARGPRTFPDGTIDELQAALEAYLAAMKAQTLPSRIHPYFGNLPPRAWRRFHFAHFEHHLGQFGA